MTKLSVPTLTRRLLRVESDAPRHDALTYPQTLETGLSKVRAAADLVQALFARDEAVLVVGVHDQVLTKVSTALRRAAVLGVEQLGPATSGAYVQRAALRFRAGATKILIAPAQNLIGMSFEKVCRHVVFAELDTAPGAHLQAEARVCSTWSQVYSHILVSDGGTDHAALAAMGSTWLHHVDPSFRLRAVARAA